MSVRFWTLIHMLRTSAVRWKSVQRTAFRARAKYIFDGLSAKPENTGSQNFRLKSGNFGENTATIS